MINDHLKDLIKDLPHKPGVYKFLNSSNKIIYIGKAKNLKKRVFWLKRVLPLTWEELISDKDSKESKIDYHLWRENILKFLKKGK